MFFDLNKVIAEDMFLSFCVSERGAGKTYSSVKWLINNFAKTGEQFIYLRRSQTELDNALPKLFDPYAPEGDFLDNELKVMGETLYYDNEVCGYGLAVSTAYKKKSVSYARVKYILFDEFIQEDNKYLKDELHKFLSCIETVGRMRDISVICLANQNTVYNPYYIYFDVRPASPDTPRTRFRSKSVLIYQFFSTAYRTAKKNTRFGQLISGTKYGDFLLDNKAIHDDYTYVNQLDGVKKTPMVNMFIEGVNIVAYHCWYKGDIIIFFKIRELVNNIPAYNFDKQLKEERVIDNVRNIPAVKRITRHIKNGTIAFNDMRVKNIIESFIF